MIHDQQDSSMKSNSKIGYVTSSLIIIGLNYDQCFLFLLIANMFIQLELFPQIIRGKKVFAQTIKFPNILFSISMFVKQNESVAIRTWIIISIQHSQVASNLLVKL